MPIGGEGLTVPMSAHLFLTLSLLDRPKQQSLIVYSCSLAGYVESLSNKLGFEGPKLSSAQLKMTRTVVATNLVGNTTHK